MSTVSKLMKGLVSKETGAASVGKWYTEIFGFINGVDNVN